MMRTRSSNSSGAVYLDREARLGEVKAMARRAAERIPEIRRVLLFGSLVTGIPTPRSDADLLVEIDGEIAADLRDRAGAVSQAMSPLRCPVDLFVYTTAELQELLAERAPVVATALRDGVDLLA
jgi:predicted nucleotidyltransferase